MSKSQKDKAGLYKSLYDQLPDAYQAYETVARFMNSGRVTGDPFDRLKVINLEQLTKEFVKWLTKERRDAIARIKCNTKGLDYTLVVTPYIPTILYGNIVGIADHFGWNHQKHTSRYNEPVYHYSLDKLAGYNDNFFSPVAFCLMLNDSNSELCGSMAKQQEKMKKINSTEKLLRTPSLLDGIMYYFVLRIVLDMDCLKGEGIKELTYIRYFDLGAFDLGRSSEVLESYIRDDGQLCMNSSPICEFAAGRLCIK